jgi:aminoglycoside phosphotransferase (APT) family kinase protein
MGIATCSLALAGTDAGAEREATVFVARPYSFPTSAPPPALAPAPRPRRADPACAVAVTATLVDYLAARPGVPGLAYAARPTPVGDGWEGYLYSFQLQGAGLPAPWDRPLVLRIRASPAAMPQARREEEVPRFLSRLRYPVAAPLLLEEDCDRFGGPFLIMEQVPGQPLLQVMLEQPWNVLHFPARMAEAHARLHELPARAFPAPPGAPLDRQLAWMRAVITRHALDGLRPGLDWLKAHRPAPPAVSRILHLDFHPLNLMQRPDGELVVIDWTYADAGDPHVDVAMTLHLLECAPYPGRAPWERLCALVGRPILSAWYLHSYRALRPLDDELLSYYRPWASMSRLVRFGHCLCLGPEASGCKPSLVDHLNGDCLAGLCDDFWLWTGVEVRP